MKLIQDYGFDVSTAEGARAYIKSVRGKGPRPMTIGRYIALCRAKHANVFGAERETDGRLIALGFNQYSPARWAELFPEFLEYWNAATPRPYVVGSSHNATPEVVLHCWRKNMPAWLVEAIGGRNDSLLRCGRRSKQIRYARAVRRSSSRTNVGADVLRLCGRLNPEAQAEIMAVCRDLDLGRIPRVRDIDPDKLRDIVSRTSTERGRALSAFREYSESGSARRILSVLGYGPNVGRWEAIIRELVSKALFPQYGTLTLEQLNALIEGQTPVQISGRVLTAAEAHEWLCTEPYNTPLEYLVARMRRKTGNKQLVVRSVLVSRWLERIHERGQWVQLTRTRTNRVPGVGEQQFRFLDVLDEIQDVDLVNGVATGINRAFENASARLRAVKEGEWRKDDAPLAPLPTWRIGKYAMWLTTNAALVKEGDEMGHCVGTYGYAVSSRQSAILSLSIHGHRSTVEISPTGVVRQHMGAGNQSPPPQCARLLQTILRANKGRSLW